MQGLRPFVPVHPACPEPVEGSGHPRRADMFILRTTGTKGRGEALLERGEAGPSPPAGGQQPSFYPATQSRVPAGLVRDAGWSRSEGPRVLSGA